MNFARDNYWTSCPAVMDYCQFTDYRPSFMRETHIKKILGIADEHAYRRALQNCGGKILTTQNNLIFNTYNCQPNQCIHFSPLRQPEGDQYVEFARYNATRAGKEPASKVACPAYRQYPLNEEIN
jgi:hypothetical protein